MAFVCDKRHYEPLINLQQSHRFVWFTMQILISRERACRSELQSWHVKRSIARLLSGWVPPTRLLFSSQLILTTHNHRCTASRRPTSRIIFAMQLISQLYLIKIINWSVSLPERSWHANNNVSGISRRLHKAIGCAFKCWDDGEKETFIIEEWMDLVVPCCY